MKVDFSAIENSQILPCTGTAGFRDPAAIYYDGSVYCYYSYVEKGDDGLTTFRLGLSVSEDLTHWRGPYFLTQADRRYNYSSPGCVIRRNGEFLMCIQTYPTFGNAPGQICGDASSRIYLIRSSDLLHWSEPELMRVHGENVPPEDMGRMIDPYIVEDIRTPGKYLVFYKQHPKNVPHRRTDTGYPVEYMCYSSTWDFKRYQYEGYMESGENVCVLPWGNGYRVYNSPQNGVGCFITEDFVSRREEPLLTLGQSHWLWAAQRLTAGFVLDGTKNPDIGKYLMFFNGDQPDSFPFCASVGLAWSDDLQNWSYSK